MKRVCKIFGILSVCLIFNVTSIPTIDAQCTAPSPRAIYAYYGVIDQIPGAATVDAMFYAYNSDLSGLFSFNDAYAQSSWFYYNTGGIRMVNGDNHQPQHPTRFPMMMLPITR
jgi:hypothetical protein